MIRKNKKFIRLFDSFSINIFFNNKKIGVYGHTYIYLGNISQVIPYAIKKYLGENDNFIDVGANFGLWSLFASKINENGNVFSFEPVILSSKQKTPTTNLLSSSIVSVYSKNSEKIKLKKLDDWNIKNIKVIKIDVEGFEEIVLQGLKVF